MAARRRRTRARPEFGPDRRSPVLLTEEEMAPKWSIGGWRHLTLMAALIAVHVVLLVWEVRTKYPLSQAGKGSHGVIVLANCRETGGGWRECGGTFRSDQGSSTRDRVSRFSVDPYVDDEVP